MHRSPGGTGLASEDEPQKAREKTVPAGRGRRTRGPEGQVEARRGWAVQGGWELDFCLCYIDPSERCKWRPVMIRFQCFKTCLKMWRPHLEGSGRQCWDQGGQVKHILVGKVWTGRASHWEGSD